MAVLDPVINFGKVEVSGHYSSSATSIELATDEGNKLPSVFPYNLIWFDPHTYPDPSDDPNREIVRCTAKSGDTLTVTRAQESTSASAKDNTGKTYQMILCPTKKLIDDIGEIFTDGYYAGGGDISVASGEGFIRSTDSATGELYYQSWSASTQTIPNNTTRYVVVQWNGGSPTVALLTSFPADVRTNIYLGEVHNLSGTLQIHSDPRPASDFANRIMNCWEDLIGTRVRSGEIVTDATPPSRKIAVSAGTLCDRFFRDISTAAFDSSAAGTFTTVYRDGSGEWTRTTGQTNWPNTKYDDGTGTLVTINAGNYANVFVIRGFNGNICVQYGQNEYANQSDAEAESTPSSRPEEYDEHGFYIAKITFQESGTVPLTITSIKPTMTITGTGSQTHNSLGGLQGGAVGEYYHLSQADYDARNTKIVLSASNNLYSTGTVVLSGGNNITVGTNGQTITISAFNQSIQTQNLVSVLGSTGNISFANSNGITFGGNLSTITASHNGITSQSIQTQSIVNSFVLSSNTAGVMATISTGAMTLAGGNNITLSQNGNAITISGANVGGAQTGISGIGGSDSTYTSGTVIFSGQNNITIGTSVNGASQYIRISAGAAAGDGVNIIAAGGSTANTTGTIVFSNSNGVSFGLNGATVTASCALTSQSNQALSGSNASFTFQTATFGNLNGMSFYTSNGSMVGSYTVPSQTNQTLSLAMIGNTAGNVSSMTVDARSLTVQGLGVASVGLSTSAGGSSILVSVAGAGADGYNSAQFAGTTANTTMPILWAGNSNGSGNITLGLTGSTVTGSAAAGGGGATISYWDNVYHGNSTIGGYIAGLAFTGSHRSLFVFPLQGYRPFPADITANTWNWNVYLSGSTATMSQVFTSALNIGIYTVNGSSLSLLNSCTGSFTKGPAATNNSTAFAGTRWFTIHSSQWSSQPVFKGGSQYYMAWFWSSAGVLNQSGSIYGFHKYSTLQRGGTVGVNPTGGTGTSQGWGPWYGIYTATTGAFPASIGSNQLNKIQANAGFNPQVIMNNMIATF